MYYHFVKLPAPEAELLRSLSPDLPALRARVSSLRARGWTLAAIGAPLGANRSTVRSWEHHPHAIPNPDLPPPPDPDPPPLPPRIYTSHPSSPAHTHPLPTPDQAARVTHLAPLARRARAGTPPSSNLARARDELNALVLDLHLQGVPTSYLADLAGVTYRAMSVRISQAKEAALT